MYKKMSLTPLQLNKKRKLFKQDVQKTTLSSARAHLINKIC